MDFNLSPDDDERESGISTSDSGTNRKESGISTPLLSVYNDTLNNIDPLLLISASASDTLIRATVYDVIDIDNFTGIDKRGNYLAKVI
jgi:hypothetical protein